MNIKVLRKRFAIPHKIKYQHLRRLLNIIAAVQRKDDKIKELLNLEEKLKIYKSSFILILYDISGIQNWK
jgi:hypothetical protein